MFPAITIFGREFGTYSIMAGAGALLVLALVARLARLRSMSGEDEVILALACAVPTLAGGSLLFALTNISYIGRVLGQPETYAGLLAFVRALAPAFGGVVFYGGLFGALLTVVVYARVRHQPIMVHMDILAVAVPLFHTFGRVGCFLGGCCFGVECDFGIVYSHDPLSMANGVPRFPVQLLEAACDFVLFLVLCRAYRDRRLEHGLIYAYFASYGCVRFFDEFLRGDLYRGFLGPLSTSQWVSLVLVAVGIVALLRRRRGQAPSTATAAS